MRVEDCKIYFGVMVLVGGNFLCLVMCWLSMQHIAKIDICVC